MPPSFSGLGATRGATRGLTAKHIEQLTAPATGRLYVTVGGVTGLQLVLTASGARSWVLRYRRKGEGRKGEAVRLTIGDGHLMSLADARRAAEQHRAAITRGEDPVAERKAELTRQRETPRMNALITTWLDEHMAARSAPATVTQYRRLWANHARPALGDTKVPDVTVSQIDAVHRKASTAKATAGRAARTTKPTANRTVAMLGSFFQWCERHGYRARNTNPTRGLERHREEDRERYLTEDEISRLGAALIVAESVGLPPSTRLKEKGTKAKHRPKSADRPIPADPFAVGALRFALLSGWRISEVCSLRWDALDVERGTATLAQSKTGRSVRPLGGAALAVLDELPRVNDSPFVFPSSRRGFGKREDLRDGGKSMGVPRRLWESVKAHAQLEGVRIHDLRHSFGASAADAGNSLIMIAALLGHKQTKTTERYAKARRDVRQNAADIISGNLSALLSKAPVTPVTPIAARRKNA